MYSVKTEEISGIKTNRTKLIKLLLAYINYLNEILSNVNSINEMKQIISVLTKFERLLWIQCHAEEDLSNEHYYHEVDHIYNTIDKYYLEIFQ